MHVKLKHIAEERQVRLYNRNFKLCVNLCIISILVISDAEDESDESIFQLERRRPCTKADRGPILEVHHETH